MFSPFMKIMYLCITFVSASIFVRFVDYLLYVYVVLYLFSFFYLSDEPFM